MAMKFVDDDDGPVLRLKGQGQNPHKAPTKNVL